MLQGERRGCADGEGSLMRMLHRTNSAILFLFHSRRLFADMRDLIRSPTRHTPKVLKKCSVMYRESGGNSVAAETKRRQKQNTEQGNHRR